MIEVHQIHDKQLFLLLKEGRYIFAGKRVLYFQLYKTKYAGVTTSCVQKEVFTHSKLEMKKKTCNYRQQAVTCCYHGYY